MSYAADLKDKLPQITAICRRYGVRELSLFGSALGPDFCEDSDLDFLVDYHPGAQIGLFAFSRLRYELEDALHRKVDLVTKKGLKPLIRDNILQQAQLIYAG